MNRSKFKVIAEFIFSSKARDATHDAVGKESASFTPGRDENSYCRYEWEFGSETDADIAKARLHRCAEDHRIPMNINKVKS